MDRGDAQRIPPELELELSVAAESVEPARQAVLHWLDGEALSARVLTTIELVIEEVVMNLALHAFDDPRGEHFRLRVRRDGDELQLSFEDRGRDFDPGAPAPARDDTRPGGLGLPLLRKRVRWMRHTRRDGHNLLTLAVGLASAG